MRADRHQERPLPHLCTKLRWKSRTVDVEHPPIVWSVLATGGVTCTCVKTGDAIGEDALLVAPEACAPSRACYVEDPVVALSRRTRVA